MEIKIIGVVGCGQMGSGIAQVCAQSGYQVVASEINEEFLNRGLASIDRFLTSGVERGRVSQEDKDATLSRLKGTTDIADFADCDMVIEAAVENLELKKKIFTDIDKIVPKHAILASNTSCLSITDMAVMTGRPDKVLGTHFFNPVPLMKLLEIVTAITTSDETRKTVEELGTSLGKTIVTVGDAPGFITNRLMMPQVLEATRLLEAGYSSAQDIDTAMTLALNHPMGPFALMDLIGIDTIVFIADAMYAELKDSKFVAPALMRKMVTAGWLGRKSGKGFYEYTKT